MEFLQLAELLFVPRRDLSDFLWSLKILRCTVSFEVIACKFSDRKIKVVQKIVQCFLFAEMLIGHARDIHQILLRSLFQNNVFVYF